MNNKAAHTDYYRSRRKIIKKSDQPIYPKKNNVKAYLYSIGMFLNTLVNVYVDLVVFTRLAGTSWPEVVDIGVNII